MKNRKNRVWKRQRESREMALWGISRTVLRHLASRGREGGKEDEGRRLEGGGRGGGGGEGGRMGRMTLT